MNQTSPNDGPNRAHAIPSVVGLSFSPNFRRKLKETTAVFEKLFKFVSNNLKNIVENPSQEGTESNPARYRFRLQKNHVYYGSELLVNRATNISRKKLVSLGTQIKKFTYHENFHLTVHALSILTANAMHNVWLKPILRCCSYVPSGFGVAAKLTVDCRKLDPSGIVVLYQAVIGEYLRMEDDL
ncbi:hypothetical protein Nepgr_030257 [Nepenthes gracilis]|uniref:60S ribosome subunit biogenesis protein NIP7 homolog n=1 Tax=Nepenthes gracilis TaxID=150966 RepID=A0AAD3TFZ9_NEPGR|nr:hypothetical protein Nepgr_030257 [Nepenthes gracilis]